MARNDHGNPQGRCAVLVGPQGSGKTTLFEDMLFAAGAIPRRGTVKDGTTTGDTGAEARARLMSTEPNMAAFDYLGDGWTLIDCPGAVDLAHDAQCAMAVADIVVVVAEPVSDRAAALAPVLKFLDDRAIPHLLYVNKMDQPEASVRATLHALQAVSARPLVLRAIPIREGGRITGHVDLVSERAFRWNPHRPSDLIALPDAARPDEAQARTEMLEKLADFDDGLMEDLLEDTVPPPAEIYDNLSRDLAADLIVPVFFGSAENENGITRLMKALRHDAPGPDATAARLNLPAGEPLAQVFRTAWAGQQGKLSWARIWRGEVRDGASLGERVGGVLAPFGRKLTPKPAAQAGEVVALGRLAEARTGDLLTPQGRLAADWPDPPEPVHALAIRAERPSDEVKLSAALTRLCEEDPALRCRHLAETGETLLEGQGETHLALALARMKADSGLSVTRERPQVPFRETITQGTTIHARHKKQSGGHGEFADVTLEIRPQPRGAGFAFDDRITGGVVPKQYIPAVQKGVEAFLTKGPLGHPMVDVAVTLTDGGYHTVDSSDMAFQKAAQKAMAEAMPSCGSLLLEPVLQVALAVPSEFTPRVQRIVTGRRGQLLGFDTRPGWPGWDEVQALIPQAETHDLIAELRAASLGTGSFRCSFAHLQETVPPPAARAARG
ncbi:elongation factor G [Ruixingdingia sedimenti]|uniref:Elongation factor G n=1 Tax=Ruixingdingia sedimenti TaxID=3073604 RepID=A0ABU1FCW6_9RHOB|nr:elongation factor G [Xinfangfangia sp. LG-4]MDR5654732.1 elongation factor G [Xinfangfangia sp. LG-4]